MGADVNATDNQGYSALAFAASFGHTDVLAVLGRHGADPNVQDAFGITPLIHAAARGDFHSPRNRAIRRVSPSIRATSRDELGREGFP